MHLTLGYRAAASRVKANDDLEVGAQFQEDLTAETAESAQTLYAMPAPLCVLCGCFHGHRTDLHRRAKYAARRRPSVWELRRHWLDSKKGFQHTGKWVIQAKHAGVPTMRKSLSIILILSSALWAWGARPDGAGVSIRLDTYAQRRAREAAPALFSLPPKDLPAWSESECVLYTPGGKAQITVEIDSDQPGRVGEISLTLLVSGGRHVLHQDVLKPGTYGPYEVSITSDFEVYQVQVRVGDSTETKSFYGIRPWRGMKDFSEAVSPHVISLDYDGTTPWDTAIGEAGVPLSLIDAAWALSSYAGEPEIARNEWWLWTHYACGLVGLENGRTGLFWGEYNPWNRPRSHAKEIERPTGQCRAPAIPSNTAFATDTMLPNEIYIRERIRPMLRTWAENLGEKHPGVPLTVSLGKDWGIGCDMAPQAQHLHLEILRYFVLWMKEHFGISIEDDTFRELIEKCTEYPKHLDYFVARNTTFRSLELTCEAVQDVAAGSRAWNRNGESSRQLVALPEAAEFCEILSRCVAVGTSDDRTGFNFTRGNPLPHGFSNMIIKAFAPDHNFSVGWSGCPAEATDGQIYRWYLEQAWLTTFDRDGKLRHVYTHSPPKGTDDVWRAIVKNGTVSSQKLRAYDVCFQLMEAIGVEKPIGPVFVCKDWTFADDKGGTAFRSDLYEHFLLSLRRHKVPISSAVHVKHEGNLPPDLPTVYAPRMDGAGKIRFGFRAGCREEWFTCDPSKVPDSLVADFAQQLNSATGNPVMFPSGTSIGGYAFEAKEMKFIVGEEMAGRKEYGEIKVKVHSGGWTVIDLIGARQLECRREGEYVVFLASLDPNSATLYCVAPRRAK